MLSNPPAATSGPTSPSGARAGTGVAELFGPTWDQFIRGGCLNGLTVPPLVSFCPLARAAPVDGGGAALHALARRAGGAARLAPGSHRPLALAPPETFSERREPLRREEYWDQPPDTACELLYNELRAIRQTLDLPPEALSGLTRNGLLTAHAIRLRQLEWRLWPRGAARAIRAMTT
jgi:hypothetical protein